MNREQFNALPPTMQLKALTEVVLDGRKLEDINYGKRPLPPKYDARIWRRGGYQWASETDTEGLKFWLARARTGAASGGPHAEKDAKRARELERWLAWREWEPRVAWHGQRYDAAVRAAAPSNKPQVHESEKRSQIAPAPVDDDEVVVGEASEDDTPYG